MNIDGHIKNSNKQEAGFTLIEVLFALLILSLSLTVVLGTQSSIVAGTRNTSARFESALIAKSILSAIEYLFDQEEDIEAITDSNRPASEVLSSYIDLSSEQNKELKDAWEGYFAQVFITSENFQELNESYQKIDVVIHWSGGKANYEFFLPSKNSSEE